MSDEMFWKRNGLIQEVANIAGMKNSNVSRLGNIWNWIKSLFM